MLTDNKILSFVLCVSDWFCSNMAESEMLVLAESSSKSTNTLICVKKQMSGILVKSKVEQV